MKITLQNLNDAAGAGVLSGEQAERLWTYLQERHADQPGFHLTHILYYLGGLIAIGAMTLFMTLGWERFGGWGICAIALGYLAAALVLLHWFMGRGLKIPAGIMGALAVALVPLAIYGLQQGLGFWPDGYLYRDYHIFIDWRWLLMELGTLAGGALLLYLYRLPFMVMPVAVTLWYLSMDLTPFLFHDSDYSWELRRLVSLWFGLAMTLFGFWVDLRSRRSGDFAFWLYLFGVAAFWGGLSLMNSESELGKLGYCGINLLLIFVGAVLSRKVFVVFGGFGVAGYLGHLAYSVFRDSLLFPFALSAIGLAVIGLGIIWQKREERITRRLRGWLPAGVRELIELSR